MDTSHNEPGVAQPAKRGLALTPGGFQVEGDRVGEPAQCVFGAAHPHPTYLFANKRANRMKVLVHDGIGAWLVAGRLNAGRFVWPVDTPSTLQLTRRQFDALDPPARRFSSRR